MTLHILFEYLYSLQWLYFYTRRNTEFILSNLYFLDLSILCTYQREKNTIFEIRGIFLQFPKRWINIFGVFPLLHSHVVPRLWCNTMDDQIKTPKMGSSSWMVIVVPLLPLISHPLLCRRMTSRSKDVAKSWAGMVIRADVWRLDDFRALSKFSS